MYHSLIKPSLDYEREPLLAGRTAPFAFDISTMWGHLPATQLPPSSRRSIIPRASVELANEMLTICAEGGNFPKSATGRRRAATGSRRQASASRTPFSADHPPIWACPGNRLGLGSRAYAQRPRRSLREGVPAARHRRPHSATRSDLAFATGARPALRTASATAALVEEFRRSPNVGATHFDPATGLRCATQPSTGHDLTNYSFRLLHEHGLAHRRSGR